MAGKSARARNENLDNDNELRVIGISSAALLTTMEEQHERYHGAVWRLWRAITAIDAALLTQRHRGMNVTLRALRTARVPQHRVALRYLRRRKNSAGAQTFWRKVNRGHVRCWRRGIENKRRERNARFHVT